MPLATADAYRGAHVARLPHVVLDLGGPRITDAAICHGMPNKGSMGKTRAVRDDPRSLAGSRPPPGFGNRVFASQPDAPRRIDDRASSICSA